MRSDHPSKLLTDGTETVLGRSVDGCDDQIFYTVISLGDVLYSTTKFFTL